VDLKDKNEKGGSQMFVLYQTKICPIVLQDFESFINYYGERHYMMDILPRLR